jgi:hypothetical protein
MIFIIGRLNKNSFIRERKLGFRDLTWTMMNKKGMTQALELCTYNKEKSFRKHY